MGPTEQQMGGVVAGGDTGDIIISSGPDKPKVSRPLLLGIIIGVLVLIGGAVAAVVLLNSGKGGGTSTQVVTKVEGTKIETADDYKSSFLLYANYVLTGVASTDALPEGYDPDGDYAMWDVYENKNSSFMTVASSYLDNFTLQLEEYIDGSDEDFTYINSSVQAYESQFEYVRDYVNGDIVESAGDEDVVYYSIRGAEIFVIKDIWRLWSIINDN